MRFAPNGTVTVALRKRKPEAVEAELRGPLAIHHSVEDASGFTVTHAETGRKVISGIPYERAHAFINRTYDFDWDNFRTVRADIEAQVRRFSAEDHRSAA